MVSIQPQVITRSDPSKIVIEWADGHETTYRTAELRAICPCANCVDEVSGVRTHDPESVPAELTHRDVQLVGNYAISLVFSDGHQTGIYTFGVVDLGSLPPSDPGWRVELRRR